MNQTSSVSIASTLLFSGLTLPVIAQEIKTVKKVEKVETLARTVITATRSPESITDTPYTASLVERTELDEHLIRSIPDAFVQVPGVLIQKTAHGHGSPHIRGFTGRQNLLLVDGIRMNNSTWRGGPIQYWNTFDQENLNSLELIKGLGSVLYGSDAVGGTVNLTSRSSDFMDKQGFFSHGRIHYRFDTNSESHVGRLETSVGEGGKWGFTLGLTNKDFGDIKDSAVGRMSHTGYSEQNYDMKFEAVVSPTSTLTLAHQYTNQDDINRWHRTRYNPGWIHNGKQLIADQSGTAAAFEIYDQERSLTYARLSGSFDQGFINNYACTLSYQKSQDSTLRDRTNIAGNLDFGKIDLETYGVDLQFESKFGPGNLLFGADYYRDEVDTYATRNGKFRPTSRPVADDSNYDIFGIYTQYQWKPIEKLELTPGVRYSYAKAAWDAYRPAGASVDQSGENNWDDISLSIRANYELTTSWSLYGGISQAFRAPNLDDLTGSTFSLNGLNSFGSIDVEPEEYVSYEFGTRYATGNFIFGFTSYYNDLQNQILGVSDAMGGNTASNAAEGYIFGFEFDTAYIFADNWEAKAWAAWQDGKQDTLSELGGPLINDTINRMHPFMGGASIRWTAPSKKFWIEPRVIAAATATNVNRILQLSGNDDTRIPTNNTPAFVVASIYSGYQVNDNLELILGLENIFDEDYRYHGSGQNETGINAVLGVTATF